MWYTRDRFRVERATALAILCAVQQGISAASLPARDEEPDMTSFDLVSAAAVLAMVGGLAAVLWEVLTKDPRSLLEMMDDSRRFAEAPVAAPAPPPEASARTGERRVGQECVSTCRSR